MSEYFIGQIFNEMYPPEASEWCNDNQAYIEEIEPLNNVRRFEIKAVPLPTPAENEREFKRSFFFIPSFGWYRKKPKGYQSAVESLNSAFNIVTIIGKLPAETLIFYQTPNFTDPSTLTEEWLVAHQIKNEEMTTEQFGTFYATFLTVWNTQEHN